MCIPPAAAGCSSNNNKKTLSKEACSSAHWEAGRWLLPGMIYDAAEHLI